MPETETDIPFFYLLAFLLSALAMMLSCCRYERQKKFAFEEGGIVRGDVSAKEIALVLTGHEFAEGGEFVRDVLRRKKVRASFFFTGEFYRRDGNKALITGLKQDGHYLGPHSDKHLLYCAWENRGQLLVTKDEFSGDLLRNYQAMEAFGISKREARFFIPPYEWYNEEIASWAKDLGFVLCNFTSGTLSNTDYTTPGMSNYRSSTEIYQSILDHEKTDPHGLRGFILLVHIGTHPDREDKFYSRLEELLGRLQKIGYHFVGIDDLLGTGK